MSEKKELNNEELEKVSGGEAEYKSIDSINWLFTKGGQAFVELTDGTKVSGTVTKRGFLG